MPDAAVLEHLRQQIKSLEISIADKVRTYVSTSFPEVDRILPGGGIPLGSFTELIAPTVGSGAFSLALRMASGFLKTRPAWIVVDSEGVFNPAALHADLRALLIVRPPRKDAAWTFAQCLLSHEVGASFWVAPHMDNMLFRRFQLSAERGSGLGFVIRPPAARRKPAWSGVRFGVERIDKCTLALTVLHTQGGHANDTPICVTLKSRARK